MFEKLIFFFFKLLNVIVLLAYYNLFLLVKEVLPSCAQTDRTGWGGGGFINEDYQVLILLLKFVYTVQCK